MIKRNSLTVDTPLSSQSTCEACHLSIQKNSMRIAERGYMKGHYFHFECFHPKLNSFIENADVKCLLYKPEDLNRFYAWLNEWNSGKNSSFVPLTLAPKFKTKVVNSEHSNRHRVWVEILSFLQGKEMVKTVPFVCKEFYHISWQGELWRKYSLTEFSETVQLETAREFYISRTLNQCIECHNVPSKEEYYRCPMLNRVLCSVCSKGNKSGKFMLFNKSTIEGITGVSPKHLDLAFAPGLSNTKVTYMFLVEAALGKFYARNHEQILQELRTIEKSESLIAELAEIQPKEVMYLNTDFMRMVPRIVLSTRSYGFLSAFNFITTGKSLRRCLSIIAKDIEVLEAQMRS